MDGQEIGWSGVDWFNLARYRDRWWDVVEELMSIWVHRKREIS